MNRNYARILNDITRNNYIICNERFVLECFISFSIKFLFFLFFSRRFFSFCLFFFIIFFFPFFSIFFSLFLSLVYIASKSTLFTSQRKGEKKKGKKIENNKNKNNTEKNLCDRWDRKEYRFHVKFFKWCDDTRKTDTFIISRYFFSSLTI